MLAALALAAALQADTYVDDAGCRWKRRPVAVAKAASGVKKPVKKRPAKAKPAAPDDEFIGCDTEGFAVMRSDLEDLDFIRTEVFETSELIKYEAELELVPPVPVTFCDCGEGAFVGGPIWPTIVMGGPVLVPGKLITTPVPEPETWLLMFVGLLALWRRFHACR